MALSYKSTNKLELTGVAPSVSGRSRDKLQLYGSAEFCCEQRYHWWILALRECHTGKILPKYTTCQCSQLQNNGKLNLWWCSWLYSFSFRSLLLVLSLQALIKSLHLSCKLPYYWKTAGAFSSPGIWRKSLCLLQWKDPWILWYKMS